MAAPLGFSRGGQARVQSRKRDVDLIEALGLEAEVVAKVASGIIEAAEFVVDAAGHALGGLRLAEDASAIIAVSLHLRPQLAGEVLRLLLVLRHQGLHAVHALAQPPDFAGDADERVHLGSEVVRPALRALEALDEVPQLVVVVSQLFGLLGNAQLELVHLAFHPLQHGLGGFRRVR